MPYKKFHPLVGEKTSNQVVEILARAEIQIIDQALIKKLLDNNKDKGGGNLFKEFNLEF